MTTLYGTLAEADTYHTDRGNTAWTGTDDLKNEALLRGSISVDARYRGSFDGEKTDKRAQDREWPRNYAYDLYNELFDNDEIPQEVIDATYEMSLRELVAPGSTQPDLNFSQYKKSVAVSGAVSVTYSDIGSVEALKTVYTLIDSIIAPVLTAASSGASRLTGSFLRS